MLMVPPKIAPKQWNCRSVVTETLLVFRAVSRRTSPVSKLALRPAKRDGAVGLISRMNMGARLLDNTNFDLLRGGML